MVDEEAYLEIYQEAQKNAKCEKYGEYKERSECQKPRSIRTTSRISKYISEEDGN
jgi:hypothetical protein